MRELGFRVWDNEEKEYSDKTFSLDQYGLLYVQDEDEYWEEANEDRFVIEFGTGLKDKNGKEIYEGDIVKAKIQGFWETGPETVARGKAIWNLEVIYNDIRYMNVFHILGSKNQPDRIYYLFDEDISDIEVIGNIHENKELVGGEDA